MIIRILQINPNLIPLSFIYQYLFYYYKMIKYFIRHFTNKLVDVY